MPFRAERGMIDIGDFLTSRKGRKGMAEDFVALMQAIAPEMAEAMARRAMVLTALRNQPRLGGGNWRSG